MNTYTAQLKHQRAGISRPSNNPHSQPLAHLLAGCEITPSDGPCERCPGCMQRQHIGHQAPLGTSLAPNYSMASTARVAFATGTT
jgi:hypothetical protein